MSDKHLLAVVNGIVMGVLRRRRGGQLSFEYDSRWLSRRAFPLSFSMKLSEQVYGHETVSNFLWNLLPDNEFVIDAWAREFRVSPRDVFGLIEAVGQDVAGAVGFVSPQEFERYVQGGGAQPLSDQEIASRLRALKDNAARARKPQDIGKLSLAGAQAKTAFQKTEEGWALPFGRVPTTHIFKVPRADLAGHVENEHFCLSLARKAGLNAVDSSIQFFEDQPAIVLPRYDRVQRGERILRRHQEDMCQALGVHPARKYESDGGPRVRDIMEFLRGSVRPSRDRERFMDALVFNFLIGGTDAHAKNYSVVMGLQSTMRLAPLYDLTSIFPYVDRYNDGRLAMKIGHYDPRRILPRHFVALAKQCHYPPEALLGALERMAQALPDLATDTAAEIRRQGLDHAVLDALVEGIAQRCSTALRQLKREQEVKTESSRSG